MRLGYPNYFNCSLQHASSQLCHYQEVQYTTSTSIRSSKIQPCKNGEYITLHSNVHRCFVLMTDKMYKVETQCYKNYPVFSNKALFCGNTKILISTNKQPSKSIKTQTQTRTIINTRAIFLFQTLTYFWEGKRASGFHILSPPLPPDRGEGLSLSLHITTDTYKRTNLVHSFHGNSMGTATRHHSKTY